MRCGVEVRIAETYARVLSVLSWLLGVILLWTFHVRLLNIIVFAPLMWLLVLFVMVRVVPYIVPPRLEVHDAGSFTTLGLTNGADEEHKKDRLS
jgi:prepilin signal peptidase PulO-like enzyme (type II secretory pathway)